MICRPFALLVLGLVAVCGAAPAAQRRPAIAAAANLNFALSKLGLPSK